MEKAIEEIVFLYDLYGSLLTENQQNIFELYYYEDLSLGEISENIGISRQAVRDSLKRAEAFLKNTDDKLKFSSLLNSNKTKILNASSVLNNALSSDNIIQKNNLIKNAESILADILKY